jgi:hypothetical protein
VREEKKRKRNSFRNSFLFGEKEEEEKRVEGIKK